MEQHERIKTYTTETFRRTFVQQPADSFLFKAVSEPFFVVRLEEVMPLLRLPIPPSRETNHKIIFITAGELETSIGPTTYKASTNQLLIIPSGHVFAYNRLQDGITGYACLFQDDYLIHKSSSGNLAQQFQFLDTHEAFLITPLAQQATDILMLFRRLDHEYRSPEKDSQELIQAYLLSLLLEVKRAYANGAPRPVTRAAQRLTARFRSLLANQYASHHLVAQYADQLNVTPNHLTKSVREVTGQKPSEWISRVLVLEAKVLLVQSQLTISQIADELGFADPSYFSRLFRRITGHSPQEYRRLIE